MVAATVLEQLEQKARWSSSRTRTRILALVACVRAADKLRACARDQRIDTRYRDTAANGEYDKVRAELEQVFHETQ